MSFALKTLHYQPQHSEQFSHDAPSQGWGRGWGGYRCFLSGICTFERRALKITNLQSLPTLYNVCRGNYSKTEVLTHRPSPALTTWETRNLEVSAGPPDTNGANMLALGLQLLALFPVIDADSTRVS